jgi:hypothetical protein
MLRIPTQAGGFPLKHLLLSSSHKKKIIFPQIPSTTAKQSPLTTELRRQSRYDKLSKFISCRASLKQVAARWIKRKFIPFLLCGQEFKDRRMVCSIIFWSFKRSIF